MRTFLVGHKPAMVGEGRATQRTRKRPLPRVVPLMSNQIFLTLQPLGTKAALKLWLFVLPLVIPPISHRPAALSAVLANVFLIS